MVLSFARNMKSDKSLIKKCKTKPVRTSIKGGTTIAAQVEIANNMAKTKLQKYQDEYEVLRESEELREYLQDVVESGIAAIDTETTGLNPLVDNIVGICLYCPGRKAVYVPINHKSYITGVRTSKQLSCQDVADLFKEIEEYEIKWVFHNAKFDIRVIRHSLGLNLSPYWDTNIASHCIDENDTHKLKDLHLKCCNGRDTESLTFDKLFGGISFDNFPIETAYLYAAGDALKTYELYEYQKQLLNRRVLPGCYNVFMNIEMPLIEVVADMEDRGVCLDFEYCQYLEEKYSALKEEAYSKAYKCVNRYGELVENYKMANVNHKLSNPISLTSPTQLAILFYDIFKLESPDSRKARGTGEDILKYFAKETKYGDLCNAILDIRGIDKLINTYIQKMPNVALEDGRVHASYNQYGAKTGRFSSSDPNLQNIPSHNKEIRKMFKAQDGYVLIGADYSQQEPMVTAYLSQDKKMMDAFRNGKDIYSTIASLAFHKSYQECLEFNEDGSTNYEGKERRGQAKIIVLSILYGKQIPGIAEDLGVSTKEAQKIYNSVLRAFPQLAKFIEESQSMARKEGYVTTAWGRRRHLEDMQLPEYEFHYSSQSIAFDPLNFDKKVSSEVPASKKQKYLNRLRMCRGFREKNSVIEAAKKEGILIINNGGYISQAQRQCVNARVQGSAADMIKLAMISINNDERMKELDFHLILQVHDEVIGECPRENMKECAERLEMLMKEAPKEKIKLPFKCDTSITTSWYGEEI